MIVKGMAGRRKKKDLSRMIIRNLRHVVQHWTGDGKKRGEREAKKERLYCVCDVKLFLSFFTNNENVIMKLSVHSTPA
jgi:hypothetical protein